jgi:hypothetical protein
VLELERSFCVLEVRWQALPGYIAGSLGAFRTLQRVALLVAAR